MRPHSKQSVGDAWRSGHAVAADLFCCSSATVSRVSVAPEDTFFPLFTAEAQACPDGGQENTGLSPPCVDREKETDVSEESKENLRG